MSGTPAWFERKFDFSFPVELLPNLKSRLRGTAARLEDTIAGIAPAVLLNKPQGKWSAQEHVGHLLDLEALWLVRLYDYVGGADRLTAADLTNRKTDEANHNARPIEHILRDFRSARAILLGRVDVVELELFSRSLPHPRLQTPMRLVDHLFFVAEHDDHHLAQIQALVGADE